MKEDTNRPTEGTKSKQYFTCRYFLLLLLLIKNCIKIYIYQGKWQKQNLKKLTASIESLGAFNISSKFGKRKNERFDVITLLLDNSVSSGFTFSIQIPQRSALPFNPFWVYEICTIWALRSMKSTYLYFQNSRFCTKRKKQNFLRLHR